MKKKILSLLLVSAMVLGLAACGSKTEEPVSSDSAAGADAAVEDVAERTTFVVGFDAGFPPFGYKADDGSYVGFDLDLAQEVATRNGWEMIPQPINWDSKDMELNSGTIDCIWNGFTYTGREDKYTWTVPYIDSNIMVVVRADSDINEFSDLAGKKVCVQADSSGYYGIAGDEAEPENKALVDTFELLEQVDDYNMAFESLAAGTYDAVVVDVLTGNSHMFAKPDKFRMLDGALLIEQCAVGFKTGNTQLRDVVQDTMFEMLEDGTIEKIVEKYADSGMGMNAICLGDFK